MVVYTNIYRKMSSSAFNGTAAGTQVVSSKVNADTYMIWMLNKKFVLLVFYPFLNPHIFKDS